MISNPQSTYYQRPDIEYQQLTQNNNLLCTVGANLQTPDEILMQPTAHSTGNGHIFLSGTLTATAQIVATSVMLTVPLSYLPLHASAYLITVFSLAGVGATHQVLLNLDGTLELAGGNTIDTNHTIYFNSIFYFQKFTK